MSVRLSADEMEGELFLDGALLMLAQTDTSCLARERETMAKKHQSCVYVCV